MLREGRDTSVMTAVGAMSGTSLDGVDVAVIKTDGQEIFGFGPSRYRPYTERERVVLRAALGCWPGDDVAEAKAILHDAHVEALAGILADTPCDLIGFHGQTLAHDPGGRGTHQLGDGAALAKALGRPVVWDFRSEDVAQGGQGAPLAPFYHFACARYIGATAPLAFLNLGGVGNITWVDPTHETPDHPNALLAFDTGPANAPLNDMMQQRLGLSHDADGALAAQGTIDRSACERFLQNPYFTRTPPKSLDRDDFSEIAELIAPLSDADAAATLCAFATRSVAKSFEHFPKPPTQLLVTGGGRHNPVMMEMLAETLPCPIQPVEAVGLDGDMLEAQAFAFLAVRVARDLPTSGQTSTGVDRPIAGGRLTHP